MNFIKFYFFGIVLIIFLKFVSIILIFKQISNFNNFSKQLQFLFIKMFYMFAKY